MLVDIRTGNLIVLALHAHRYLGLGLSMGFTFQGNIVKESSLMILLTQQNSKLCFLGDLPFHFSASFAMKVNKSA